MMYLFYLQILLYYFDIHSLVSTYDILTKNKLTKEMKNQ